MHTYTERDIMIMCTLTPIMYCRCWACCKAIWYTLYIQSHLNFVKSEWAINWLRASIKLLSQQIAMQLHQQQA